MRLSLHKRKGPVLFYWQAWVDGRRLWIRQGEVGAPGDLVFVPLKEGRDPAEAIGSAAREPRADGFAEFDDQPRIGFAVRFVRAAPDAAERLSQALHDSGNDGQIVHAVDEGCTLHALDGPAARHALEQVASDLEWDLQVSETPAD